MTVQYYSVQCFTVFSTVVNNYSALLACLIKHITIFLFYTVTAASLSNNLPIRNFNVSCMSTSVL